MSDLSQRQDEILEAAFTEREVGRDAVDEVLAAILGKNMSDLSNLPASSGTSTSVSCPI